MLEEDRSAARNRLRDVMDSEIVQPKLAYFICTSPRTGSSLLASSLASTGCAGRPDESFALSFRDEVDRSRELGVRDYREYPARVIEDCTTDNGVFGTKIHAMQTMAFSMRISDMKGQSIRSFRAAVETISPNVRYVLLKREAEVRQAISLYRAIMSGQWHAAAANDGAGDAVQGVEFDQVGIKKCLMLVEACDNYWEQYFVTHEISPHRVSYEELSADYESTIRSILSFLGIDYEGELQGPSHRRLADQRSAEWEEKYLALEAKDPVVVAPIPPGLFAAY